MRSQTTIMAWEDSISEPGSVSWIVSREDGEASDTLSIHDTRNEALAAAAKILGHDLTECHDCGVYVDPADDRAGCGCHCPNCSATL